MLKRSKFGRIRALICASSVVLAATLPISANAFTGGGPFDLPNWIANLGSEVNAVIRYGEQIEEHRQRLQKLNDAYNQAVTTYDSIQGFRSFGVDISLSDISRAVTARSFSGDPGERSCLEGLIGDDPNALQEFEEKYGYNSLGTVLRECTPQYNAEKSYKDAILLGMAQPALLNSAWTSEGRSEDIQELVRKVNEGGNGSLEDLKAVQDMHLALRAQELSLQSEIHHMLMIQLNMQAAKENREYSKKNRLRKMFVQ